MKRKNILFVLCAVMLVLAATLALPVGAASIKSRAAESIIDDAMPDAAGEGNLGDTDGDGNIEGSTPDIVPDMGTDIIGNAGDMAETDSVTTEENKSDSDRDGTLADDYADSGADSDNISNNDDGTIDSTGKNDSRAVLIWWLILIVVVIIIIIIVIWSRNRNKQ